MRLRLKRKKKNTVSYSTFPWSFPSPRIPAQGPVSELISSEKQHVQQWWAAIQNPRADPLHADRR